jgi:hypothetical protein
MLNSFQHPVSFFLPFAGATYLPVSGKYVALAFIADEMEEKNEIPT